MIRFLHRVRDQFRFEQKELLDLAVVSLCFGFLLSFRDWGGGPQAQLASGILNLVNATLVVFLSMVIALIAQKLYALKRSHTVSFRAWYLGLAGGLFLGFLSSGFWLLLVPGGLLFSTARIFKLGDKYEGNILHASRAYIAFLGPLTHLLLAYLFSLLAWSGVDNYLVQKGILLNVILGIITILPIPQIEALFKPSSHRLSTTINLDGFYILYHSRIFYVFALFFIILLAILLFQIPSILALLVAFIIAGMDALIYTFSKEL